MSSIYIAFHFFVQNSGYKGKENIDIFSSPLFSLSEEECGMIMKNTGSKVDNFV